MEYNFGFWLGLLGIILAVVGYFFYPIWLGIAAVVLGFVALYHYKQIILGWLSIILGVIILLLQFI
ncbi:MULTISPECIES: C4-dicarboxylate ABC transporter [Psychrobacillus]|uniref:C4-dicarboxylate ABC transporter n=1 Tax=Psychrobacillus faecigallinarum TaxID=2762235 RepID=A0ABR8R8G1_9BACI|nr:MULTISPECIES: C4-dicarboxylate ABC transporter [Psychrobacillus]MBD7944086.1 C4-dicarboxylate ABC transporter [Psychrobacillus faecigallinarum]QEY20962.1 C4-dicarboxylate ABC transporter [Psychrobacillus sp. AK 1817]QGM31471.1 C4-dicarboxylate ABC transporter [Bacillus sp. N3536]